MFSNLSWLFFKNIPISFTLPSKASKSFWLISFLIWSLYRPSLNIADFISGLEDIIPKPAEPENPEIYFKRSSFWGTSSP